MLSFNTRASSYLAVLIGIAVIVVTFGSAGSAAALPYPVNGCNPISISTTTPHAGQSIIVDGTGFQAGAKVSLVLHSPATQVGTATVANNGTFRTSITIPAGLTGRHLLSVQGGHPSCPADPVLLTIANGHASSGGPSHGLAVTGTGILAGLAIALALIGTGVLLNQRAGRRRQHSRHAA